jgi:ketosteroid isomerase-like protein
MKKIFSSAALALLFTPGLVMAQASRDALITAETDFAKQATGEGIPAALVANSTTASLVADNGRIATVNSVWQGRTKKSGALLSWSPVLADVAQSGELGYTTGPWTFSLSGKASAGEFLTIWRKQSDGKWKLAVNMSIEHAGQGPAVPTAAARPQAFVAAATPVPVPFDAVLALDRKFSSAELFDPAKAYNEYLSAEGRLYRPGQLPLVGTSARNVVATIKHADVFAPVNGYLAASGDLGYVYGTVRRPADDHKQPDATGSYLRIWRREAAAGWRLVAEVINFTAAEAPPAAQGSLSAPTGQVTPQPKKQI